MSLLSSVTGSLCLKNFKMPSMFNLIGMRFKSKKGRSGGQKKSRCKTEPECYRGSRVKVKCAKREWEKIIFKQKPPPHESMWDTIPKYTHPRLDPATGCRKNCLPLPLFDWLYYRRSDKAKRQYQKTWADCPSPMVKISKVCCMDMIELPPIKRRKRKGELKDDSIPTACECNVSKFAAICKPKPNRKSKCPLFEAPKCRMGRKPPRCENTRSPSNCKKDCCPYSSYSECCQQKPATLFSRPPECYCLVPPSMCTIYREMRRQRSNPKPCYTDKRED